MTTSSRTPTSSEDRAALERSVRKTSKKLSWLLRHGAGEAGLRMDSAGWASIADVLTALRIRRHILDRAVAFNNKSRFDLDGDKIRASQGHSLETTPVTQEGLESTWALYRGNDTIWHGTNVDALEGISQHGVLRGRRSHVHLAAGLESRVGKRAHVHVMLAVSVPKLRAQGIEVFESPNGVVLARRVPVDCITSLKPISRRARELYPTWRGLFPFMKGSA